MQHFFAFKLYYQFAIHDKIRPKATVKFHRLIDERNRFLPFTLYPAFSNSYARQAS